MLYSNFFYHGHIRKYVDLFGYLFNKIEVVRYQNDIEKERVTVPIAYGPKEKFWVRNTQDNDLQKQVAIQLPRLAFEHTGFKYDGSRKQLNNIKLRYKSTSPEKSAFLYQPVPYDIEFSLYGITKSADEMGQILEQIMPFFTPDYTEALKLIPSADVTTDIPISLVGMNITDKYEGNMKDRREMIFEMKFIMKAWFYGPVKTAKYIRDVKVNIVDIDTLNRYVEIEDIPDPPDALPTDPFGYTATLTEG